MNRHGPSVIPKNSYMMRIMEVLMIYPQAVSSNEEKSKVPMLFKSADECETDIRHKRAGPEPKSAIDLLKVTPYSLGAG